MGNEAGTRSSTAQLSFGMTEQRLAIALMLLLVCGFLWYIVHDAIMVTAAGQFKRLITVSPLLLIVLVHWLATMPPRASIPKAPPASESGAIHRAGGSAWGIAFVLLFLLFLISYQPSFYRLKSLSL